MTFSNIKDRGMTEAQGRSVVARSDRQSWYPGTQAHHAFAILSRRDSREVCRAGRRVDRDQILALARAHDAMKAALADARSLVEAWCHYQGNSPVLFSTYLDPIDAALKLAEAVK